MKAADFTYTLTTDKTPEEVFQAITQVRTWWFGLYDEVIKGGTEKLNDEFTFNAGDGVHYSKHKLVEVIPNQKIVWLVTDSELTFIEKTDEWTGGKVIFDIAQKEGKTQLTFTHQGLTPEVECYNACSTAWSQYLQEKLLPLINTGKKQSGTNH